ncbi:hypothetical protein [Enterococcus sp. AZ196]|uniref:hypothetical protein n=1 Tax=Enterococcus sp. AZ196 TaxID=2774659 RepID=UPI003D2E95FC
MKVKMENRVLTINESEQEYYLQQGYDVVEFNKDSGEYDIVKYATGGKSYSVAEYEAMRVKYEEKIKVLEEALDDSMSTSEELTRDQMITALKAAEVNFKGNISNVQLKELYVEHIKGDGK